MAATVRLLRHGKILESIGLLLASLGVATLVAKFGNEKTILVAALLSWVFLAGAFIHRLLRNVETTTRQKTHPQGQESDDPNSLTFTGVGPGFQGFGMYAHGVRVGNESINDDA